MASAALRRFSTLSVRKSSLSPGQVDEKLPPVEAAPSAAGAAMEEWSPSSVRALRRSYPYTLEEQEFRTGVAKWELRMRLPETGLASLVNRLEKPPSNGSANPSSPTLPKKQLLQHSTLLAAPVNAPHQDLVLDIRGFGEPAARETLWWDDSGLDDIEPVGKDLAELAGLFPASQTKKKRPTLTNPVKVSNAQVVSVLEARRATALTIAMRKLKLQPSKLGKLAWALRDMNESFLTPAAVELLLRSQPWAISAVETAALKARVSQTMELAEPDQLVWFLTTTVPDAKARLDALTFKSEFAQNLQATVNGSTLVKIACKEIMNSVLLRRLFRVFVYVVNKINAPSAAQPIAGIPIEQWPKLAVPGPQGVSVLQYVAGYCTKNFPELLEATDEVLVMPVAKNYSLEQHLTIVADARRGLDALRAYKSLEPFVLKSRRQLDLTSANLKASADAYKTCLAFFCIDAVDAAQLPSHDFMSRLHALLLQFDQAAQDFEDMQKKSMGKRRTSRLFFSSSTLASMSSTKHEKDAPLADEAADVVGELPPQRAQSKREPVKVNRKSIFGTMRASKPPAQ